MPRIPEGKFNKTPSVRVGAQRVPTPAKTGLDRAMESASKVTSAFAKLQDQKERTDAFNNATDKKREYEQEKSKLLTAMEASDENGNFSYHDPMSDPDNPVVIEGNIQEELNKMNKNFNSNQMELGNLERGDIAMDLHQQYVGDDLNKMRIKAGKTLFRKKKKAQWDNTIQVIDFGMTAALDASVSSGNTELGVATAVSEINKIDRTIAGLGTTMSTQEKKELGKYRDRMLKKTAEKIIINDLNDTSIAMADKIINRINDPFSKEVEVQHLEKVKKTKGLAHDGDHIADYQNIMTSLGKPDYMSPEDQLHLTRKLDNMKKRYYSPEYSRMKPEDRAKYIADVEAKMFAKFVFQDGTDVEIKEVQLLEQIAASEMELDEISRAPSAEGSAEKRKKLEGDLKKYNKEVDAFLEKRYQAADFVSKGKESGDIEESLSNYESKMEIFDVAKKYIKDNFASLGRTATEVQVHKYPEQTLNQRISVLKAKQDAIGVEVPYATIAESKAFQKNFKGMLKSNKPHVMRGEVLRQLQGVQGGDARAYIDDLVRGDKELEFLLPVADFAAVQDIGAADQAIRDAHMIKTQEKILSDNKGLSLTAIEQSFNDYAKGSGLDWINEQDNSYKSGLKSLTVNRAKAIIIESKGSKNINKAMDEAMEWVNSRVQSVEGDFGSISVVAPPNKRGDKFTDYRKSVAKGAKFAMKTLPTLSDDDKKYILTRYMGDSAAELGTNETNHEALSNLLYLDTHPRHPNVYRLMWDKKAVTNRDREEIEFTADELHELSKDANKEELEKSTWRYR